MTDVVPKPINLTRLAEAMSAALSTLSAAQTAAAQLAA